MAIRRKYVPNVPVADHLWEQKLVGLEPTVFLDGTPQNHLAAGLKMVQKLTDFAGLSKFSRVLDFGCGAARLGMGIQRRFGAAFEGLYLGIDCNLAAIQACHSLPWPRHQREVFAFQHLDVRNPMYNAKGELSVHGINDILLPGQEPSRVVEFQADLVVMSSVLSHCGDYNSARSLERFAWEHLRGGGKWYVTLFASPPNAPCAKAARTVFKWREIFELFATNGWVLNHLRGGHTSEHHDQCEFVLERPFWADLPGA